MANPEKVGQYYWGVRIVRGKKNRDIHFHADKIEIRDGDLLLWGHLHDEPASSFLYRVFARGTWQDVFAANVFDGTEIGEEHDVDVATGVDARHN